MDHRTVRVGPDFGAIPTAWRPLLPAWLSVAAVTIVFAAMGAIGYQPPLAVQLAVYLLGMVAVNLPHGGFEHVENLRRRTVSYQFTYAGSFLLVIAGFLALLFVNPLIGVGLMLWVAMAKGGLGDVAAFSAVIGEDYFQSTVQRYLAAAAKGGAVMIVPFVAWQETFVTFTTYMVSVFDASAVVGATWMSSDTTALVAALAYGAVVLAHLGVGFAVTTDRQQWAADAIETLLLIAFFVAVPVVVAVGLYFALWYSLRQLGRSWVADDHRPAADGAWMVSPGDRRLRSLFSVGSFVAGAIGTALVLAAIYLIAPRPFGGAPSMLAGVVVLYTIFVSIIALPHVLVGGVLDRQGIWFVPERR